MNHKISIEVLFHFNCGNCEQWWSISGWEPTTMIICPHCGISAECSDDENQAND